MKSPGFLKTCEPVLVGKTSHVFLDSGLELRVLAQGCKVTLDAISGGPLARPCFFGDNDCDDAVFERVTVDKALGNATSKREDVLDLLWGDVLSLRGLENVLAPVDDLDRSILEDLNHVSRHEPAIGVEGLSRLLRILEVALEKNFALHEELTSRVGLVCDEVLHCGQTLQSVLDSLDRATHVAGCHVSGVHHASGS